jgi:hypothetical protein
MYQDSSVELKWDLCFALCANLRFVQWHLCKEDTSTFFSYILILPWILFSCQYSPHYCPIILLQLTSLYFNVSDVTTKWFHPFLFLKFTSWIPYTVAGQLTQVFGDFFSFPMKMLCDTLKQAATASLHVLRNVSYCHRPVHDDTIFAVEKASLHKLRNIWN